MLTLCVALTLAIQVIEEKDVRFTTKWIHGWLMGQRKHTCKRRLTAETFETRDKT